VAPFACYAAVVKLILMGLRGSGKSTLGRKLSERTGLAFVDLDEMTAARLNAGSVAEAWAKHGQAAFRVAEVEALRAAVAEDVGILALGGGTPTAPGALEVLRGLKRVEPPRIVYLRATAAALEARLRRTDVSTRPSLTGKDPVAEIADVLAVRDPAYRELADLVLEVGGMSEAGAVDALMAVVRRG
jgi:shikimate kinase